nr:hypothetical protein [Tanacetum cinerariifolium]
KREEKRIEEEQAAKAQNWKFLVCYDDDDDKEGFNSLPDNIISELPPCSAITPNEPIDSLIMEDEHFDTILATESDDEFNPIHNEDLESTPKNDRFDTEPYLLESLPNRIDEADCDPEEDIHLVKRLLYNNSSHRPPEEIVSGNSNVDIESFSPYPILNEDSASHMEEIDLFLNPNDPMPSSIEEDDDDSKRDIPIFEELPNNYSLSLPASESYHFDIPLPYRPPAKPPDGITGTLNIKMMGDVSDQKVHIPNLTITRILNQDKSLDLLSHQGFEAFQPYVECPMIINGKNIPLFIAGNMKTLAKGFVLKSSFPLFNLGITYPNLID